MVFQRYALFPHMSVAKNIAFPLKMRGVSKPETVRRVEEALAMVRLTGLGARRVNELSGGQQQRVAVARALVFEPPVLLMDEPLGALDKKLREELQLEIKRLHKRLGVTILYVTHDQEEALTMSDRVAVMREGRLVQIGSPVALYERPANAFVAQFIGKMNFLDAEVVGIAQEAVTLRLGTGEILSASHNGRSGEIDLSLGQRVRAAIRPERLRLRPRGAGGPPCLGATVEAAIFVGSFRVFLLRLAEGAAIEAHIPAGEAELELREGDRVEVTYPANAVQLF
jgi:mannopine transport system ATP-binding protein